MIKTSKKGISIWIIMSKKGISIGIIMSKKSKEGISIGIIMSKKGSLLHVGTATIMIRMMGSLVNYSILVKRNIYTL